jgi:hypothetical protein
MKNGFALNILVLIVALSPCAYGMDCKVNDPDIANHYEGGCKNGLAHGEGIAKGRDEYKGSFLEGNVHGFGEYSWGDGTEWDSEYFKGWHYKGPRSGYGEVSVRIDSKHKNLEWYKENGVQEGNRYVVRGLWLDHSLVQKCSSQAGCFKQFADSHNLVQKSDQSKEKVSKQRFRSELEKMLKAQIEETDLPDNVRDKVGACFIDMIIDKFPAGDDGFIILDKNSVKKLNELISDKKQIEEKMMDCVASSVFKPVDFNVLKVDIESMKGDRVSVDGIGIHMMDMFIIKKDEGSANMISVDISNVDRDQKIMVLNKCSNPIFGCKITVYGSIDDVNFESGIVAKLIKFR